EAERVLADPPPDTPLQRGMRTVYAARLALGRGDRATALRLLDQALGSGPPEVVHRALATRVLLHRSAGEADAARAASVRLDEAARTAPPGARPPAPLRAAAARRDRGRAEIALELARADGLLFEEAQARLLLGRDGDSAQLQRAHALFAKLG